MKLITKIFICILSFILLSLTLLHFALVYILPIDDVKNKIITIIEKNTNASVSINKISASLLDFSLNNVDISSGQEKFAHIEKVHIYFSPLHLLKGKIKILSINLHTVELDVVKNEYGHFNFENLINKSVSESEPEQPSEKEQKETKEFINLLLCKTHIQNGAIRYIDLQNKLTLNISQISFFIEQFSFDQIFKLNASVQIDTNLNNKQFDTVYLALNTFINLHSLDLNKAKIDIDNFVIKFKETVILLNGNIENFNDPAVNLNIKIKDLSHNTFADIAEIPEFLIPEIDITAKIIAFIEKRNIRIDSLNIATMDSTIDLNGNLDYGQKEPAYDFKAS
ncbi:MAG: AsmA family protein, partial [Endomicrobiaceae bacterium]|nr:AsmA family protein [Endomicrobiaceae bacterium]